MNGTYVRTYIRICVYTYVRHSNTYDNVQKMEIFPVIHTKMINQIRTRLDKMFKQKFGAGAVPNGASPLERSNCSVHGKRK